MKKRCVEIKFKDDSSKRLVTFTKRRNGLFSKAKKLSDLTGAQIAVLVLSRSGKPYSFGCPNVDTVIDRFLGSPAEKEWWDVPMEGMGLEELRRYKEFLEDLGSNLATKQVQESVNTLLDQQEPHDHDHDDQMVKIEETQQHEAGSLEEEEESSFWFPNEQLVSLDDIFHDDVAGFMSPATSNDLTTSAALEPYYFDFQY